MDKLKTPIVEIHGTGIHNRGAELMAIAISERIKAVYPDSLLVVPSNFGYPVDIKRYGFKPTFSLESISKKAIFSLLTGIMTRTAVNPAKVDVVLDASGFAFSDQWGARGAKKLYYKMKIMGRSEQLLILLPQALGSFEKAEVKKSCIDLFTRAKRIFPRDSKSFHYVKEVFPELNKVQQCPDFTVALTPKYDSQVHIPSEFVAIVPNIRMLDKLTSQEEYLTFLKYAIKCIEAQKLTPVFVIHDAQEDTLVVEKLGESYSKYQVIQHEDPRVLKGILGKANYVIGSRFHALVSTLSQGVPCIGAGWSHKYPELFADFATRETLIDDLSNLDELGKQIECLSNIEYHLQKSLQIQSAATRLKEQVEKMWKIVLADIKIHLNNKGK